MRQHAGGSPRLSELIARFLTDLQTSNRAGATIRTYTTDLQHFAAFYHGAVDALTSDVVCQYCTTLLDLKPASPSRKQAALASFCTWAYRHDYLATNPMLKVDRVRRDPPTRQGITREQAEAMVAVIPKEQGCSGCCSGSSSKPGCASARPFSWMWTRWT